MDEDYFHESVLKTVQTARTILAVVHERAGSARASPAAVCAHRLCGDRHPCSSRRSSAQTFRWAGDPEGGAPYVEASPDNPDVLVGFDVEIADLLARGLGRTPQFVFVHFDSIDSVGRPRRRRHRPERHRRHAGAPRVDGGHACRTTSSARCSRVRDADAARFRTLADLAGRRVATLGGTIAYEILLQAQKRSRHHAGLVRRRRASVLGSGASAASTPCCSTTSSPIRRAEDREGIHGAAGERRHRATTSASCRPANAALRDRCNEILRQAMRDGTLERILRKWQVWNDDQPPLLSPACWRASRSSRSSGLDTGERGVRRVALGRGTALSAVAAARVGRHDCAVVHLDGAGGARSAC